MSLRPQFPHLQNSYEIFIMFSDSCVGFIYL